MADRGFGNVGALAGALCCCETSVPGALLQRAKPGGIHWQRGVTQSSGGTGSSMQGRTSSQLAPKSHECDFTFSGLVQVTTPLRQTASAESRHSTVCPRRNSLMLKPHSACRSALPELERSASAGVASTAKSSYVLPLTPRRAKKSSAGSLTLHRAIPSRKI